MEKRIFNVKSYYETKSYNQVQTKLEHCFQKVYHHHQKKTLNMNKERSRRRITTRKQQDVEAVCKHQKK